MFSQLVFVRLRAADRALREGRIDEAYRLASATDLREHRRAGEVRAVLSEKFLARAREHFDADRFREALEDLDRAADCGGPAETITALRSHVTTVAEARRAVDVSQRARVDEARRKVDGGSLQAGQRLLHGAATDDAEANRLRRKIDERSAEAERIAGEAEQLLNDGRLDLAAQRVARAAALDGGLAAVHRLETELCRRACAVATEALDGGRPRRAADALAQLGEVGAKLAERIELEEAIRSAEAAGRCLARNELGEARRYVQRIARALPGAEWASGADRELMELDERLRALRAGPLGDWASHAGQPPIAQAVPTRDTMPLGPAKSCAGLPDRLLLLVDGGGSYLLLRGDSAVIGRTGSDAADIPLLSDISERHATVRRIEDDYFVVSDRDVEVGGRATRRALLRSGDRLVLGRKAKFDFRVPSRQSATAVLDLSDTTRMPHDVRRVVLLDGHATIGSGPSAHIGCRHAGTSLVVYERPDGLWIRTKTNGHGPQEAKPLRIGAPVEMLGVSLVLSTWPERPAVGAIV